MVATHTSHKSHEVCSRMTNRPPQGQAAAYKPKVHVRGRDSGLSLGISACQQRCRACVPAHRQAAVGQASCAGAVGKLQGQGLCGWPLCATRGSRHSRGVGLLPGSLCRFGRDPELLRGDLLHLVRSCSCLLGSRSQIGGRPHWLGCTQCFAGVYAEGPAPAAASASHRERSAASRCVLCFELIRSISSSAHSASVVRCAVARLAK